MRESTHSVFVLGAGPVGLIATLELSKTFDTTLVVHGSPSKSACVRVDSIPASLLALLLDFGVHPKEIGVDSLHNSQIRAWVSSTAQENPIPASAHVERPLLEGALLRRLKASTDVTILPYSPSLLEHLISEAQHRRTYLLDATGRRSISSRNLVHAARPWVARSFVVSRRTSGADPEMRIVSLPHGYAYRMGSSQHLVLVVVGRGALVSGSPQRIERYIVENGAGWILQELPSLSNMVVGNASTASVQWSIGGPGCRIGDAAFARDSISGQGVALGITDAMCAVASLREQDDFGFLHARQAEQRNVHLRSLGDAMRSSRFASEETWREYSEFLNLNSQLLESGVRIALRHGRLSIQQIAAHSGNAPKDLRKNHL